MAHTTTGYMMPVSRARTSVAAAAVKSWRRMSVHPQAGKDQIDELDADERGDHAAQPVDEDVAAQDGLSAQGLELHTPQGQGDEQDDDDRIEDDGREDGRVGVVELHDVERLQAREHPLEH